MYWLRNIVEGRQAGGGGGGKKIKKREKKRGGGGGGFNSSEFTREYKHIIYMELGKFGTSHRTFSSM